MSDKSQREEERKYNEIVQGLLANKILPDFSKIFGDEIGVEKCKPKQVKK